MRPLVLMPHDIGANLFLSEIARAYVASGCDVVVGRENLTHLGCRPQLLHLHWPEEHFLWHGEASSVARRAAEFLARLDQLKARGAYVVWHVHNLHPHEGDAQDVARSTYQGVIDRADLLVHHCPASIDLLGSRYVVPGTAQQAVTPFGNSLAYPNGTSREDARRTLGIPDDRFVFLHFGAVRAYKGLDFLLEAFGRAKVSRKLLLIAGRLTSVTGNDGLAERLELALRKRFSRTVRFDLRMIPEDEVQHYFRASDVVLLGHRWGLNSGVAVLGMGFEKVVVGPNCGCIEYVLKAGENVIYEAGEASALSNALTAASEMDLRTAGAKNRAVVESWSWTQTVQVVLEHFGKCSEAEVSTHGARN